MRLEESAVAALEVSSNATGCPELVVWCQNFRAVKKCDERRNGLPSIFATKSEGIHVATTTGG